MSIMETKLNFAALFFGSLAELESFKCFFQGSEHIYFPTNVAKVGFFWFIRTKRGKKSFRALT